MGSNGVTRLRLWMLAAALCAAAAFPIESFSQVVLPDRGGSSGLRDNVFGLGLAAGSATGVGLSFRHHLPSVFSYQITGGIIKVDDRLSYSIGFEGHADLARSGQGRFFVGGGVGYYYSGRSGRNELSGPARIGAGIGGEIHMGSGLHCSGELLFTYFSDGNVLPLPQVALFYYFY
jgi:hypothetical protein